MGHHVGADAHQGPLANPHPAAQVHPGRDVRVILNSAVMIDCAAGVKDHIGPYHAARIDHDTGTDRGPRANLDPGSNNRAGMARGDKALAFLLLLREHPEAGLVVANGHNDRIMRDFWKTAQRAKNGQPLDLLTNQVWIIIKIAGWLQICAR